MTKKNTNDAAEGIGCATMILATGIALALFIWSTSGFPKFW